MRMLMRKDHDQDDIDQNDGSISCRVMGQSSSDDVRYHENNVNDRSE
jgi:hypothetical protein